MTVQADFRSIFTYHPLYFNGLVGGRGHGNGLICIKPTTPLPADYQIPVMMSDKPGDIVLGGYSPIHDHQCTVRSAKPLVWHRPKANKDTILQSDFYAKLQARDIADIFRFVNEQCHFLLALTPLQPRHAKKIADDNSLMAAIIAQAMNHCNLSMAETSDIPYHVLETTHQQCLRLATLKAANDRISNFIARLSIFPHYSFDLEVLYGSVDGQKFKLATSNIKTRHSRKYF